MSARVVVGALTGNVIAEEDAEVAASVMAGYSPKQGTDWTRIAGLLTGLGVPATGHEDATTDDLRESLDDGKPAIVIVDPSGIWRRYGLQGGGSHAVVVEKMDDVSHTVTLVDSAWTGGVMETVPMSVFLTAWDTFGHLVVTVDHSE